MAHNGFAIAEDIEDPGIRRPFPLACRRGSRFRVAHVPSNEVQYHTVFAGWDGNCVGEVPPALCFIEVRVIGAQRGFLAAPELSALEVAVSAPPATVVGVIGHITRDYAHWPHVTAASGQDFDSREHRRPALCR